MKKIKEIITAEWQRKNKKWIKMRGNRAKKIETENQVIKSPKKEQVKIKHQKQNS